MTQQKKSFFLPVLLMLYALVFSPVTFVDAQQPSTDLISVTKAAEEAGFTWRWESAYFRLTCVKPSLQIKLYEDNAFCLINGKPRRLAVAPVRSGATLWLPKDITDGLFGGSDSSARQAALPAAVTSSTGGGKNIISVATEKKSNGTLLLIQLADSLPLDITYFYPNLTFNFFGGRLDTSAIRQDKRIGVVDSIFATQFGVSAQVTAILAHEIDEPMIDYVEDTHMVMVSLWPKKDPPKPVAKPSPTATFSTKSAAEPKKDTTTTIIVLDPGHGGKDPGAISGGGIQEKDIVLAIALKVRDDLKKYSGIKVYMTREKDVFIPLADRTKFANDKKAHLFISIHANAIGGNEKKKQSTNGYKIYFLSQAKNEEDKLAAMRENAVIELEEKPQNYTELQNVLIEMAGNEYMRESQDLCILLDKQFGDELKKKITKLNKGIGQANFWVLNGAFMPSVLIETGFISHKKEEKLLSDAAFQKTMAVAISDAVVTFCKRFGGAGL